MAILDVMPQKGAGLISGTLKSAVANAVNNNGAKEDELFISECFINPGSVLKRYKIGSRSRVNRNDHRTSHITVKVSDGKKEAK